MPCPGSGVPLLSSSRSTLRYPTLPVERVLGPPLRLMSRQVLQRKFIPMLRQSSRPPPPRRVGLSRLRLSPATLSRRPPLSRRLRTSKIRLAKIRVAKIWVSRTVISRKVSRREAPTVLTGPATGGDVRSAAGR